jgi:hypothetical protein
MTIKFNNKEYKIKTWQMIVIGILLIAGISSSWEDSKYAGVIYGLYSTNKDPKVPAPSIELYKNGFIRLHVDSGPSWPIVNREGRYSFDSSANAIRVNFSDGQPPYSFPMEQDGDLWTIKSGQTTYFQDPELRKGKIYYMDNAQEVEGN